MEIDKPLPNALKAAAYFDVDGTLAATTIVSPLIWFRSRLTPLPLYWGWMLSLIVRGPWWLVLDRINRNKSNQSIYYGYHGLPYDDVEELSHQCYRACIKPKLFRKGLERVAELKKQGVKIVLLTGGLDVVMRHLARELGADCIAPSMAVHRDECTGGLATGVLVGERKANALMAHAEENGIDLSQSYAFADSYSDIPALEVVGHPIAINPDSKLKKFAQEKNWSCENWKR